MRYNGRREGCKTSKEALSAFRWFTEGLDLTDHARWLSLLAAIQRSV
jgi:hypothetical protein